MAARFGYSQEPWLLPGHQSACYNAPNLVAGGATGAMTSVGHQEKRDGSWGAAALLVALLLGGAVLRLYNVNWDQFRLLHPDERAIAMFAAPLTLPPSLANFLDPQVSTLNPRFFAYGSFTMYLLRAAGYVAALIQPLWGAFEYLNLVGRVLSALFDLGTVALVYLLGARMYGRWTGLLASAFVTFTAFHVQLSHFYAADTPMTFALVLALVLAERCLRSERWVYAVGMGAALGLAFAFKFSALPALVLPPVAVAIRVFWPREGESGWRRPNVVEINRSVVRLLASFGVAAAVAVVLQPYAVLDFAAYVRSIGEQNAMVRGVADLPYTRQYAGTTPYIYALRNLVLWAYGPVLGIAAMVGAVYVLARQAVRPRPGDVLLLAWVVPYFLVTGGFYAKFMRYLLPIMPVLSLFAAAAVVDLHGWLRGHKAGLRAPKAWLLSPTLAWVLGVGALLGGVVHTGAFMNVYIGEHPRIAASRWLYENVPAGKVLTAEHWDDPLPLALQVDGRQRSIDEYSIAEMKLYDPDNEAKTRDIITALRRADYVVLSSNRLYGSIPRLPQRYPVTTRYYQMLFAGELGFHLERTFTNYPQLGGWQIVDDSADESFTVYDHPKVLVFQKDRQLSDAQLRSLLLAPGVVEQGATPVRLMDEAQRAVEQRGGTFAELFPFDSWANRLPLLAWFLVVELLALVALPLAVVVLRWLPDRGYLLAKPLGLLLVTWLEWQVVSAGLLRGTAVTVWLAVGVLAVVAAALAWWRRGDLVALWREKRGVVLAGEALFWAVFLVFLLLRWLNPDLWHGARGGEKPMDFAFLMAAAKSEAYPPYDPWFAGGYLNYYYFGQLLVATLLKLTGIAPTVAYNLAVPTLAAATAGGVFSVTYNLAARLLSGGERRRLLAGLTAVLLVVFTGNLGGAGQLVDSLGQVGVKGLRSAIPGLEGLAGVFSGLAALWLKAQPFPGGTDWYWASTRVYPGASVNEFPYFTFLFGDLHAHMIGLPYTLLALGICLNLTLSGEGLLPKGRRPIGEWGIALLRWFVAALALGALWPTNSWDFPTYGALAIFALFVIWYRGARSPTRFFSLAVEAAALVASALALYLPFHTRFQSFYFGLDPAPERSPLHLYFVINSIFLLILTPFLAYQLWRRHRGVGWWRAGAVACRHWPRARSLNRHYRALVRRGDDAGLLGLYGLLAMAAMGLLLHLFGYTTAGVLWLLLAVAAWLALQRERSPAETFLFGLVALGFGLGISCEFVAIKGDVGRMNTVFKFYLQVWVVWGIAAAVALALLWQAASKTRSWWLESWRIALALATVAVLVYPLIATRARIMDRFSPGPAYTLDGAAYMRTAVYPDEGRLLDLKEDYAAIQWLWRNVRGSPVVLEGWAPYYRWGARVAIYTGLPAVLGWDWHEKQQRWGYQEDVERRVGEVNDAFTSTDPAAAMLVVREFGVSYIYVGGLEKAYYPPEGLAKFDAMVGQELELVYDSQGVKIYHVQGAA